MLTIRRGRRTDVVALQSVLCPESPPESLAACSKAEVRHWRRLAQDPALDFYVAARDDALWGMLLVSYIRALRFKGWQAILELAVVPTAPLDIGLALLDFAKERARKRGCPVLVWPTTGELSSGQMFPALLIENGFQRVWEIWSYTLA